jgi:hypothetical protein
MTTSSATKNLDKAAQAAGYEGYNPSLKFYIRESNMERSIHAHAHTLDALDALRAKYEPEPVDPLEAMAVEICKTVRKCGPLEAMQFTLAKLRQMQERGA